MSKPFTRGRSFLLAAALATSAAAFALSACSDDNNGPIDYGSVAISLEPATAEIVAGGTGSVAYTVTRTAPFTGAVTLAASGQPADVGVTLSPGLLASGETTGTVDLTVAPGVAPGTYQISISAAGNNITTRSTTLTLVVPAPAAGLR